MTDRSHALTPDGTLTVGYAAMLEQFHRARPWTSPPSPRSTASRDGGRRPAVGPAAGPQASFVWNVLAAVGERTRGDLGPGATCPSFRFHPAIVAQAAATLEAMNPGRSWLGLGTGEALNEHVVPATGPRRAVAPDVGGGRVVNRSSARR